MKDALNERLHVQTLNGDAVEEPPPYLKLLLSLGPRYVPHPHPPHFVPRLKAIRHECEELARTLGWSAFFEKKKRDGHHDEPDFRTSLPYKKLFRPKGTSLPIKVIEEIPESYSIIEAEVKRAEEDSLLCIDYLRSKPLYRRGIAFKSSLVDSYLRDTLVVGADKDGSSVCISKQTYMREVSNHMQSEVYRKLDGDTSIWEEKAKTWMEYLHILIRSAMPMKLEKVILNFLDQAKTPVLAKFYLSCKTHKSLSLNKKGGWASRPLVGLYRRCTTSASILLSIGGTILLKCDRDRDPLRTPLCDTRDVLTRLHHEDVQHFTRMSTVDFSSLYTTIKWSDVSLAYRYWHAWYKQDGKTMKVMSEEEAEFMDMFFTPMSMESFRMYNPLFPFSTLEYSPVLTIGEFLLHVIFTHCVFETPGLGVYVQLSGWAMGTNAAPTWANLVLRFYESRVPSPSSHVMTRFIDDGLVLHHPNVTREQLLHDIQSLYPPHLMVEFEAFNRMTNIPYMDLLIVKVKPLETSVYFKPTHTCSYIPWGSNTPRHVKLGWVTGECIRFLRLCSHEHYFNACWSRLQGALMRLGYPKHAWRKAPRQWSDKRRYVHDRGKVNEIVHAFRVPFHSSMPIPWAAMFSRIRYKLLPSIPSLQVRVTLKSSPNLRILFHARRMRALKEEL